MDHLHVLEVRVDTVGNTILKTSYSGSNTVFFQFSTMLIHDYHSFGETLLFTFGTFSEGLKKIPNITFTPTGITGSLF